MINAILTPIFYAVLFGPFVCAGLVIVVTVWQLVTMLKEVR